MPPSHQEIVAAALAQFSTMPAASRAEPCDVDELPEKVSFSLYVISCGKTLDPNNAASMAELRKLVGEDGLSSRVFQAAHKSIFLEECKLAPAFKSGPAVPEVVEKMWLHLRIALKACVDDKDISPFNPSKIGDTDGWAVAAGKGPVKGLLEAVSSERYELVQDKQHLVDALNRYGVSGGEYPGAQGALPMIVSKMCTDSRAPFGVIFIHGTDCLRLNKAARFFSSMFEDSKLLIDYHDECK